MTKREIFLRACEQYREETIAKFSDIAISREQEHKYAKSVERKIQKWINEYDDADT